MSVCPRITVNRCAGETGNARHRLEPLQSAFDREIDKRLQRRAAFDVYRRSSDMDRIVRKLQDDAAEPIVGDDQIRSRADYDYRHPAAFCDVHGLNENALVAG